MKFSEYTKVEDEYGVGGQGSAGFMKLQEGENVIRIVSEFEVRGVHSFKNKQGKFRSAICIGKDKGCVYCQADNKVKVRYMGWVVDKTPKNADKHEIKLLEIGHTIFKQLGEYQSDPDYAFDSIPDYNVKIKATGQGLDREYQVIPSPKRYDLDSKMEAKVAELKPIAEIIQAMKDKEMKRVGAGGEVDMGEEEEGEVSVEKIPF